MKRKLIIGGLIALAVYLLIEIIGVAMDSGGKQSAPVINQATPQPSATPAVEPRDPGSSQESEGNDDRGNGESRGSPQAIVSAAARAYESISVAQFLPRDLLRQSVRELTVPEMWELYENGYPVTGKLLARSWGWSKRTDLVPHYSLTVEKYRIDKLTPTEATISFYTTTQFVERRINDQGVVELARTYAPGLNVVRMRKVDDRWLYVDRIDPKAGDEPVFDKPGKLSYAKAVRVYAPYVKKEYKQYVNTEDG